MKPTSDSAALEKRPAHTTAHNGAGRESPAALVAGIERTRDDLARTIDAIADRVSPANIARRTAGRARERVAQIDPVVAGGAVLAVTAVAVTFLLLRRRKRRLSPASPRPPPQAEVISGVSPPAASGG